jgi:hypothetical protein
MQSADRIIDTIAVALQLVRDLEVSSDCLPNSDATCSLISAWQGHLTVISESVRGAMAHQSTGA